MASAMAYFQANRGKLSGQISANVVSSSRTSEGINYKEVQPRIIKWFQWRHLCDFTPANVLADDNDQYHDDD